MYAALKKLVKAVLPAGLFRSLEPTLRWFAALPYRGNAVECPLCEHQFSTFISLGHESGDQHLLCPRCGSIQRKRLLWLYLQQELQIANQRWSVLHFSPSTGLESCFRKLPKLNYTTTDYVSKLCDVQYDITQLPVADATYDLIVCYHIMEHIPDDRKAMAELFRTLKSGGTALLQVPHWEKPTDEDPTITDPAIRLQRFGQEDHVRYYNRADFVARLTAAGFNVEEVRYVDRLDSELRERYQLREGEIIFVCCK